MKTRQLKVNLGDRSYNILVGKGILLDCLRTYTVSKKPSAFFIVTDEEVRRKLKATIDSLVDKASARILDFEDGEFNKKLKTWERVLARLLEERYDRNMALIAFGGGVVGDVAGFAASAFLRGVRYVQVPTSLLAMVDSSVGGKTAVDHDLGKNMIGAFWQPSEVWIDIDTLKTLPDREFLAGMGEVVKYAFIGGKGFLEWITNNIEAILKKDEDVLAECIYRCCQFKAEVVEEDEHESGRRAILNYGHTFGHAIEVCAGFGTLRHGEAINHGMRVAIAFALEAGTVDKKYAEEHNRICTMLNPPALPDLRVPALMEAMLHDKKVRNGKIRLVIADGPGTVRVLKDVTNDKIEKAWQTTLGV